MANKFRLYAFVCPLALVAAACNADPAENATSSEGTASASGAAGDPAADPCSFVSKEEVTAVTGEAIVQTEADGPTCSYQTEDAMASSVQVEIKQTGGAGEMQTARSAAGVLADIGDDMKGSTGAEGDAGKLLTDSGAAPNIGDQAFYGPNQQLHVLKGDVYFAVSPPQMKSRMSGGNPLLPADKKREMAAEIAQKIAKKI